MGVPLLFAIVFAASISTCSSLKVGFLGDTQDGADALHNFKLMQKEQVDLVVHNGDFDYASDPERWDKFLQAAWYSEGLNDVLGMSGNHEDDSLSTALSGGRKWEGSQGYKERMHTLLVSGSKLGLNQKCHGRPGHSLQEDYGDFMACEVDGVLFITFGWRQFSKNIAGMGGNMDEVLEFLEATLSNSDATWRVCNWHRPEGKLHPASFHTQNYKSQRAYELCRQYGAFVVSGHAHVYGRTKLLADYNTLEVSQLHEENNLKLRCGTSFSIVSGLGGKSIEPSGKYANKPWFEKIYTSDVGDQTSGVLICDMHKASTTCEFIMMNEEVYDSFVISPPEATSICTELLPATKSDHSPAATTFAVLGGLMAAVGGFVFVRKRRTSLNSRLLEEEHPHGGPNPTEVQELSNV